MTPRCPKGTRKSPCAGEVSVVECDAIWRPPINETCGQKYARCQAHGGLAGAKRSLKSHRGVYHPGEKGDER